MDREECQFSYGSKRERLLGITILLLMLMSFFLHLCAFAEIFYKNSEYENNQTEIKKNQTKLINNKSVDDIFDINLLSLFCIMAHLIWTIVSIVVLDQCCLLNNKSIYRIILKLFICTCPLLLCSELSILLLSHIQFLKYDFLIISIKWFIFLATILMSFWMGILSDKNKWRGIHGGQIAPELHHPLHLFQN